MYPVLNITNDTTHCGNLGHGIRDFEQICHLAHKHGFGGVNIDLSDSQACPPGRTKELAAKLIEKYNLKVASFGFTVELFKSDQAFEDSLAVFAEQASTASALGCHVALCYVPPFSEQLNFNDLFVRTSARLRVCKPILERYALKVGFEFIGPTETRRHSKHDFIHTLDGVRALIASAGLYGMGGFKLDIHHWQNSGAGLLDLHHLDLEYILYVELNDGLPGYDIFTMPEFKRELPLATQVTDCSGFLKMLHKKGFRGPVAAEPWNQRMKEMPLEQAIATAKEALNRSLGLVENSD